MRVTRATVTVGPRTTGAIGPGLLIYLGVGAADTDADADYLADKLYGLRVFEDASGRMNLDLAATTRAALVVPQFTLYGDTRRGRRPAFDAAMEPVRAEALYLRVVALLRARGLSVETGEFRAHMQVDAVNDGPVTLLLDSARTF